MSFSKSWKRALMVRRNNFTFDLKQISKTIDKEYTSFINRQNAEKKELAERADRRQSARKVSRERVEDALKRQEALSRSTEDLRKELSFAEEIIMAKDMRRKARPVRRSRWSTPNCCSAGARVCSRARAFSRSAEDLTTLFNNVAKECDHQSLRGDSEFKLPKLQLLPPIYASNVSASSAKRTTVGTKQKHALQRKSFSFESSERYTGKTVERRCNKTDRLGRQVRNNSIPHITVSSQGFGQLKDGVTEIMHIGQIRKLSAGIDSLKESYRRTQIEKAWP